MLSESTKIMLLEALESAAGEAEKSRDRIFVNEIANKLKHYFSQDKDFINSVRGVQKSMKNINQGTVNESENPTQKISRNTIPIELKPENFLGKTSVPSLKAVADMTEVDDDVTVSNPYKVIAEYNDEQIKEKFGKVKACILFTNSLRLKTGENAVKETTVSWSASISALRSTLGKMISMNDVLQEKIEELVSNPDDDKVNDIKDGDGEQDGPKGSNDDNGGIKANDQN